MIIKQRLLNMRCAFCGLFQNNNKENMSDIMPASANSASVRQQSLQHQYLHAGQRNKLWEQFETTTHVFRPTQNQAPPVSSGKQERPSKKLPANRPGPGQTESLQPDRDHHTRPVSAGDHSTQPGGPAVSGQGVKSGRAPAKRNYVGEESVGSRGLPKPENTDMQTSGSGDMALSQPSKMGQARARGKGQRNQLWTNQKERSGAGKEAQQGQTVLQQKNMGAGAGVGSGGRFDDDERKGPSQQQRSDGLGFQQSQKQVCFFLFIYSLIYFDHTLACRRGGSPPSPPPPHPNNQQHSPLPKNSKQHKAI